MATKVTVLGLGAMGLEMAAWLTGKFTVVGFDISAERMALASERGVATADSAAAAAAEADFIIVAVRNQAQLNELLYGEAGIAGSLKAGAIIILTSTIGIEAVESAAAKLEEISVGIVDAPVSGGPVRAGKGDLLVVAGAYDDVWATAKPVLDEMASTLVFVGNKPGKGQALKTVNQLLCGIHIAAAGEAMALAGRLGLDQEKSLEALMAGAAASFMLGDRGPRAIQAYRGETAEVKSRLDIFVKDMRIVTDTAKSLGMAVPLAAAAEQEYLIGFEHGQAAQDDSSVISVVASRPASR
ncbi:MAG: NAD(P)-dependent oxidoreductase [Arcanobacterium sp.]|nr:NAD(P)-dependent oxidoreductase [Arcanobacterium sp.]MDY5589468.1 NAD(P)-dependent oxidoreductase [Arcanobacterium sp.]